MANIAFIQNKLGKTDGVSLEVDKWRRVLEKMGHTVFYCAGNDDVPGIHCIPELSLFHPLTRKILENGTVALKDYNSVDDLLADIEKQRKIIFDRLMQFINAQHIDVLIPNNLLSVGYNIPAMPALYQVIEQTGLPTIVHSHDFYFEDSGEVEATCPEVLALFEKHAPPPLPNVRHVVINRLAQKALKEKKGIDARVVPNVFDFDQPRWTADDYNADFRQQIGLNDNDIMLLQATRVMDRKGIELAIDVAAAINQPQRRAALARQTLYDGRTFDENSHIVLVCAGYVEQFGITGSYQQNLIDKAGDLKVDLRFVGDRVRHSRSHDNGQKIYSLWDSYVSADLVTYPSYWEGWGNQFIEAVFAEKPVILFEYPVYTSDLKADGFDVISLGRQLGPRDARQLVTVAPPRIEQAADPALTMLTDPHRRRQAVEQNFQIAKSKYSYQVLEQIVTELMQDLGLQEK